MKLEIRPENGFDTSIETEQGKMVLSEDETIELMENAQGVYSVKLILSYRGYHVTGDVQSKALELAGLSGLDAARQISKGYIEF